MSKNLFNDFRKFYKSRNKFGMTSFDDRFGKGITDYMNPYIIKEADKDQTQLDIFSELMSKRQIFFGTEVNSDTANIVVSQLLYLDSIEEKDITMYVNSPGGECYSGCSILDCMDFIGSDVATVCTGFAASFGAMILLNGTAGKRSALKRSTVMIHQPLGGASGQATEIEITCKEIMRLRKVLYDTIVDRTGKTMKEVEEACDRDNYMSAQEALEFGLIDQIIYKK